MFAPHDLAAFIALADGGSVRHAAEELGRTQPAITQAIQRLEEVTGFPLFDRNGYRLKLTDRGVLFLKRVRATVQQAKDLKAYAGVLSRGNESSLRIAVHGAIEPGLWIPLLAHVPDAFPDTVIELRSGEGNAPLRRLMSGDADLAIAIKSPVDDHALQTDCRLIGDIEFVNVVKTMHAEHDDLTARLARLPQILVADFDDPDTAFGVVQGHRFWRVSDHKTKVAAIIAGLGWGSVPRWMVDSELRAGALRQIEYRGIGPASSRGFFLYQKRQLPLGPVASHIWEQCGTD